MPKRILSLMIGLSVVGVAFAQMPPAPAASTSSSTTTTTRKTMQAPVEKTQTTTTTTTFRSTPPEGAMNEDAIKGSIANAGYKEVKDLEFKNGVWQVDARGGNKQWEELRVAPMTGKVYAEDAPSRLNEDEIKAKLTAAGYTNIGHVKYDDGLWSADADTRGGKDVDLLVDPDDGSVIATSRD